MKISRRNSFTLMELLIVISIIAILSALTMGASNGIIEKGKRSRALTEVRMLANGIDSFKLDNGSYPSVDRGSMADVSMYDASPGSASYANYKLSSTILYTNLSGKIAITKDQVEDVVGKVYVTFKVSQVKTENDVSYVIDPWKNPYGYSTNAPAENGALTSGSGMNPNFFDLWSTAGRKDDRTGSTNAWVNNWDEN